MKGAYEFPFVILEYILLEFDRESVNSGELGRNGVCI